MGREFTISALRVWNYNKSEEDSHRGVKQMVVRLDSHLLSPHTGLVLRKGPGHGLFDHAQLLPLIRHHDEGCAFTTAPCEFLRCVPLHQDYWAPVLPRAHLWHLRLLTTWGDSHYMGMDALQLFNEEGVDVSTSASLSGGGGASGGGASGGGGRGGGAARVHAYPADVNVLAEHSGDPRTADKLFTRSPEHAGGAAEATLPPWAAPPHGGKAQTDVWLAPWSPGSVNELWVCFDEPASISLVSGTSGSDAAAAVAPPARTLPRAATRAMPSCCCSRRPIPPPPGAIPQLLEDASARRARVRACRRRHARLPWLA